MLTIQEIADKSEDAYSFDRYGSSGWRGAIRFLRSRGLDDIQTEAFLRSKHMRWAGDFDDKRPYGRCNGQTVRRYVNSDPKCVSPHELAALVAGTFPQ